MKIKKLIGYVLIFLGGVGGLYGTCGWLYHLINDFGVERLFLAPIILPLYNLPGVVFLWIGIKIIRAGGH